MTMEQATKDLLRDMFEINSTLQAGDQGLVQIIGTLAGHIMEAGGRSAAVDFSEANALTFAREVLYNSNRTQFGGDAYEAVDLICCNELVFATPLGQVAAPIQIHVSTERLGDRSSITTGSGMSSEMGTDDSNDQWSSSSSSQHAVLSVQVQADMTFNINVRDPTDDDEMVWCRVQAKYER